MKVLFLQKDIFAKPGIMLLSAILKKEGHDVDVLIEDLERNMIGKTIEMAPDVIAFSITLVEHNWMNRVGKELRKYFPGPIICGGAHPTYSPAIISEEYLDAICVGEGDASLPEFVRAIQGGEDTSQIPNLIVSRNGRTFHNDVRPLIEDLDSLPFFDRAIYERYPIYRTPHGGLLSHYVMMTGRGCPYACSFCLNKTYNQIYKGKGRTVRRRSVDNVIAELEQMKERNVNFVVFEDDSFTHPPREWLNDFLEKYRDEIGISFKFQTPANMLDEDLMQKLREANCHAFKMGIESGNEDFRNNVLKKHVSASAIIEAARLARKYGIRFQTFNIAGCPGETLDMLFETYEINNRIRPDFVWCSLCHPHPGTELFDYAIDNGYIDEQFFNVLTGGTSVFLQTPMNLKNKKEVINLQRIMYACVLFHLPSRIVRFLIKLPLAWVYQLVFGTTFFIGLYRTCKVGLYDLSKQALRWTKYIEQD